MQKLFLIVLLVFTVQAELYLTKSTQVLQVPHFSINNYQHITESHTSNSDICIDATNDSAYSLFVLYTRGRAQLNDEILTYGKVVYSEKSFILFKTQQTILNELGPFNAFDIVKVELSTPKPSLHGTYKYKSRNSDTNLIDSITNTVNIDSLWTMIDTLQKQERYTYGQSVNNTVTYFKEYLSALDFDTIITDNYLGNGAPNIITEKRGKTSPDEIIIICSHYDVTKSMYPGADDNGSGTAGALEIARVISLLSFHKTIRIMWFSGEEISLLGSKDYAKKAYNKGDNIIAVFNLDMIGYLHPGDRLQLDVGYNNNSKSLYDNFLTIAEQYVPEAPIKDCKNSQWINSSDHKSFWDYKYPALYFGDDLDPNGPENPHYHKLSDTLSAGVNSKPYLEGVVKSVTATVLTIAEIWNETDIKNLKASIPKVPYTIKAERDVLHIRSVDSRRPTTLKIISVQGKTLLERSFQEQISINRKSLATGQYIIQLTSDNYSFEELVRL